MKKRTIIISILIILGLLVLYFPKTQNYFVNSRELIYKNCTVKYKNYWFGQEYVFEHHTIPNEMISYYANRELILCLCDEYIKDRTKDLEVKIIELTIKYGDSYDYNDNIDSILSQKEKILDPIIYIE